MTDAGTAGGAGDAGDVKHDGGAVARHEQIDYLEAEVNLLSPSTPYMREHQRIVWTGFLLWLVTTFGGITATRLAPELLTATMPVLGFPFHYFAIAIGAPGGALLLSVWYAWKRDQLDEKYGIDHSRPAERDREPETGPATADGGVGE